MKKNNSSILFPATVAISFTSRISAPVTGRKQLNLVPDFKIREPAFSQYNSVAKISNTFP